jgi:hypothetical protein
LGTSWTVKMIYNHWRFPCAPMPCARSAPSPAL